MGAALTEEQITRSLDDRRSSYRLEVMAAVGGPLYDEDRATLRQAGRSLRSLTSMRDSYRRGKDAVVDELVRLRDLLEDNGICPDCGATKDGRRRQHECFPAAE